MQAIGEPTVCAYLYQDAEIYLKTPDLICIQLFDIQFCGKTSENSDTGHFILNKTPAKHLSAFLIDNFRYLTILVTSN